MPEGSRARDLTSACVHCGFCLPACPTYVDTRDERDSPRGRIYLIKHFLETGEGGHDTRHHLDRCLTCRNCEPACPSGMQYGALLDIGRDLVEAETPRSLHDRFLRHMLRAIIPRPRVLSSLLAAGRVARALLPRRLRSHIPPRQRPGNVPAARHARQMLILEGCVQSAATPNTNAAARRVLDRFGISLVSASGAGCCGALEHHMGAPGRGLDRMRRNIDAWWPHIEDGVEALVSSASGCGAQLVDYGTLLAHDPVYADKAKRVSELARDLAQVLLAEDLDRFRVDADRGTVAVHTPCTLRNALGEPDLVHRVLARAGIEIADTPGEPSCCGSAGTYSILQAHTSVRLRDKSLERLSANDPQMIATANIGCQLHLQAAAGVPVVHWIELLDDSDAR